VRFICIQSQWRPAMRAVWFIIPALLSACVSQSKYDELKAQNDQLQQQVSRLQGAIKYTVNSDLLFPSGGWQMSPQGQQIIAKMATKLADAAEQACREWLYR